MSNLLSVGLLLASCLFVSCKDVYREDRSSGLTFKVAQTRSRLIRDVDYALKLKIERQSLEYSGEVEIQFILQAKFQPLTIDFDGGQVLSLYANDRAVTDYTYNQHFISVPTHALKKGQNTLSIRFKHAFSKTGSGLYRFEDPEDQNVYIFSDFEPFDANNMFPCFDQPDLKASFTLEVDVPPDWTVISYAKETESTRTAEEVVRWRFPKSARMSTYVFSMHAGPYQSWSSSAGNIPLRLFARKSFARYVDEKDWFQVTKAGFEFFEKYFDYKYPFGKYDQIIVPDFNSGAMENVAAVTFNEKYCPKGRPTTHQREGRANTILHEMAHMWFGNLVTMSWWDDLWLNESFATYMAHVALAEATEFKDTWRTFFDRTKQWAYWEDQLVTTHPIVVDVKNTEEAFLNFDGITYGKGASVLKQLAYFLGPEKFREGVRGYFKKHAYGNTTMRDFVASLASASGVSLGRWTSDWLTTASLNSIKLDLVCEGGLIKKFDLLQSSYLPDDGLDRQHRTQISFYGISGSKIAQTDSFDLTYSKPRTSVPAAIGKACPIMVYPNSADYDYVKVTLDPKTVEAVQKHLSAVEDPFARLMFWRSLWDMVRDAEMSVQTFFTLVIEHMAKETDDRIVASITNIFPNLIHYLPNSKDASKRPKAEMISELEEFVLKQIQKSPGGTDRQKLWFDAFTNIAQTAEGLRTLAQILDGAITYPWMKVDQDRRWEIIEQLHRHNWKNSEQIRSVESKDDPSAAGKQAALAADAIRPQAAVKEKWLQRLSETENPLSVADARIVISHLFPREQQELAKKFADRYLGLVDSLRDKKPDEFMSSFVRAIPTQCENESVERLSAFLDSKSQSAISSKHLRVVRQEDERCVRIRAKALQ